jgi:RNA polymerase sigma-70 factor (ECF subfamily)
LEKDVQSSESRPATADETPRGALDIAWLTRRMTGGDEMAWRTFYNAYFDRLWHYLLVVAGGRDDTAREALQLALVRVARHIKVFPDETVFWGWLTVLASSAFADETKKQRRYLSFLDRFTGQSDIQLDGAGDVQANDRLKNLLERHVALLPPDERAVVEQKYFAHRSMRQIAEELQITEKAVESKLSRIRKKLKDAVLAELNEPKDS